MAGPDELKAEDSAAMVVVESAPEEKKAPEAAPAAPAQEPGELFEVVGDRAVYDVQPGEVGRIVLTPGQRFDLIAAGHIRPAAPASDEN